MTNRRLNILAFSFFPAVVPATSGGETRLYELYSALSRYHNVRLISSAWQERPTETIRHGANFREIRVQKHSAIAEIYSDLLKEVSNSADISGPAVYLGGFSPCEMHEVYFEQLRGADLIIHDSPFTISYDVMAGIDSLPRIYNSYNCETLLYSQMHNADGSKRILETVREAEESILRRADLITCCSEDDKDLLTKLAGRKINTTIVPNGGVPHRSRSKGSTSSFRAVFIGSQHYPNREAAIFIVKQLAPNLPDIDFIIIGNCLDEGDHPSNVHRLGFVSNEEKASVLSTCDVALNPMFIGSGSSLKITEFLSYGLPLISTEFGVRGLGLTPGQNYLEADRSDFARALNDIRSDPSKIRVLAANALSYFEETLTWASIASGFAVKIQDCLSLKLLKKDRFILGINDYDFTATLSGGATRIRGLYEHLKLHHNIMYIVITDEMTWSLDNDTRGFTILRVPKTKEHRDEQQRVDSQFHISAADIVNLYMLPSNKFLVSLLNILRRDCDCIITDHIYTSGLIQNGDVWVYSSQNHETSLKASILLQHPCYDFLITKVKEAEDAALKSSAAVICVSEDDARKMTAGRTSSVPILVIPNGVVPPKLIREEELCQANLEIEEDFCLFVASAHPPNVDACAFLINEVAPALPEFSFHIVGGVCESFQSSIPPNVRLWGKVDEATKIAIMSQARLALNPVDSGGGSNVKIADYFSHGCCVLSTSFGVRGFPESVVEALIVAERDQFVEQIRQKMIDREPAEQSELRKHLFDRYLNAITLSKPLSDLVVSLKAERKKILLVTYRLAFPPRGGAEAHLLKLVEYLSRTGKYDIDIVSPDVDFIADRGRFEGQYKADEDSSGPYGFPNVHWAKFPLDESDPAQKEEMLVRIWEAQAAFDRRMLEAVALDDKPKLLWGWSPSDARGLSEARWAFSEAAVYIPREGRLALVGVSSGPAVLSSAADSSTSFPHHNVEGNFAFELDVSPGVFSFRITAAIVSRRDPRPLGLLFERVLLDGERIYDHLSINADISQSDDIVAKLSEIAHETRHGCSLSLVRGPFSSSLENWLAMNIKSYDMLLTHNNIFHPVVRSIEIASENNVPSILIPHAHLDDDYYHFPDFIESVKLANTVLAAPSSAVEYLKQFNSGVHYHSPGVDIEDSPTSSDVRAFDGVYSGSSQFGLVLGRKAAAKNYRWVIEAAQKIDLPLILIGPDDDGELINEPNTHYLGRQPRSVVRGALASCMFLINMSSSESFGMVLIEAWLAKRPIIANRHCAAFRDLVEHGVNGLLTDRFMLASAMNSLRADVSLRNELGLRGHERAKKYDWRAIGANFDQLCERTMGFD